MKGLKATVACLVAGLAMVSSGTTGTAQADEGMWPYNHVPVARLQESYGFTPTKAWLDHLMTASVDIHASAAFVSPDGLILTNHHVALSSVQRLSTPEHNYVQSGFLAATRDEEIPIPGSSIKVLVSIEDVTDRIAGAVQPGLSAVAAQQARDNEIAAVEAEGREQTDLQCQVVTLFGGARFDLYRYREYTDIRLVCVPELQAAFFGGDWDNFCYPRFALDFAFLRAYADGKPVHPASWLQVDPNGISDGDLIFVSGNPGRTERLKTVAALDYRREVVYPERLARLEHQREVLDGYAAQGAEQKRRARTYDFFMGNSIKRTLGELNGLQNPALMQKKTSRERALRDAVAADQDLAEAYGSAWERIAAAYDWARAHDLDRRFRTEMPGSRFCGTALQLVRYQSEITKPDGERLPGYHEAQLPSMLRRLQSPAPVYKDMEEVLTTDAFQRLLDGLGAGDPLVQAVLQGRTPAAAAAFYLDGTRLDDAAVRRELVAGEGRGVLESTDPLIELAQRVDPLLRAVEKAFRENLEAVEDEAETQIAKARFAVYGDRLYPDATGTLRLAYGRVAGYPFATSLVSPFTTFYGLYDRAYSFGDQGDFALTPRESERRDSLDLACPLDLVCTADITGGNSGSPLVNSDGRLVGVVFDGNATSHANQFVYDETDARSVCVDVRAILQTLTRLYDAQALADELLHAGTAAGSGHTW